MDVAFGYTFPAIRGIQAGREYYVSMCPLRLIPRIFSFDEEELPPEVRAQRILNRGRIPEICRYVTENRDTYVFSALTASIDAEVEFEAVGDTPDALRVGRLRVPMAARFIINDGQHRRAAIESALREHPDLGDETIAVVFFLDQGLTRCQQMFADLNRYAIRPATSLGLLYDHRDGLALLARRVVFGTALFREVVELERSTLSPRSRRLFTLSAIYQGTKALVAGRDNEEFEVLVKLAISFWEAVAEQFPDWHAVREGKLTSGEVRRDRIHSHGIVLQSLGIAGRALLRDHPDDWKSRLHPLASLDWSRGNARTWEGRAMIGGRVSKASRSVTLTANLIKQHLGLTLEPEEMRAEQAFQRGDHG